MTALRATVVGAGGLGGPLALALGRAGLELAIVDHDQVELSNLHRQIQFTSVDLGQPKAMRLAGVVVARGGVARGLVTRWTPANADELGGDADVVIDASDDPVTKFAVADWAVARGRCYVIASALRYGGNVMAGAPGAACFRCLFEDPAVDAPSCADAGVLGPVVGAIGGVAAAVAIALARGDRALAGALLAFEDLRRSPDPRIVRFAPRPGCPACAAAPISPTAAPVRVAEVP
ncbi:MAG TPA: ThiF family adenylyltransferase [Kofleriaceae bacterium]|nr:ThiF family adenylyltransferase [Kofleriaceae bacterium]